MRTTLFRNNLKILRLEIEMTYIFGSNNTKGPKQVRQNQFLYIYVQILGPKQDCQNQFLYVYVQVLGVD